MTNQSDRQQSCRNVTATALNYEGDWHALWDLLGIPVGEYESRMLAYINLALGTTYTELNGAMAAYAISNGVTDWNSLGFFTPGAFPFVGSSQAFDFASSTALTPLAGTPLTFTRGTNAMQYRSGDGWLVYAPNNQLLYSNTLLNAVWARSQVTYTGGYSDPFGGLSAYFRVPTTTSATHSTQQAINVIEGQKYTFSHYAKADVYGWVRLSTSSTGFGSVGTAWFDLVNGVVGTNSNLDSFAITPAGSGWYRISITDTATTTTASAILSYPCSTDNQSAWSADGVSGQFVCGFQFENGPYAQAYNETTAIAYYGPRLDYNPSTLAARGLLIEEQRTNLLIQSSDYTNAAWVKVDTTITANSIASPEGINNMSLLTEGSATTAIVSQDVTITTSTAYTCSNYLKRGNHDWVALTWRDPTTLNSCTAYFNLATGVKGAVVATGAATGITSDIQALQNGIYRCSVTGILDAVSVLGTFFTRSASADASLTRVSNGTRYQYGSQIEAGTFSTSLIPTFASTATRAADNANVTISGVSSPITLYAKFSLMPGAGGVVRRIFGTDAGSTTTQYTDLAMTSANLASARMNSGTTQFNNPVGAVLAENVTHKLAASFSTTTNNRAINGTTATTSSAWVFPVGNTNIHIGSLVGTGYLNGWVEQVALYNSEYTLAQVGAITT